MTTVFYSGLSKDFSSLLNDADDYNVVIQVGENQNVKEFRAHSVILRARSPYFKSCVSTINENNMVTFNKPNVTPVVFDMILKFIYTGELNLTNRSGEDIFGLLVASDQLLIEELLRYVQDYLLEKQINWVQNNIILILNTVFKFTSCEKLRDYCLNSIYKDLQSFITSDSSLLLDKDIFLDLIKRDVFQTEEIVIWNTLIKWGVKQIPELVNKDNLEKWSYKNYDDLKNILSDFIPLINFLEITSEDFHRNIQPYKAIIPNNIYEDIMTYYLVDQPKLYSFIQIDSKIIKPKLANLISNWIDKKNPLLVRTEKKNPLYKFDLIYRSNCDGFGLDINSFKNKCKGQMAILVLIKVQNSDKIFGGYTSIGFNSIENNFSIDILGFKWYNSSDNFIFSFENNEDMKNMKISRVVNNSKAILEYINTGFNFGWDSLYMEGQNLYIYNRYGDYENNLQLEGNTYEVEEFEAFVVTTNQ
ncbi:hypothetical protein RclHR1_05610009 [Rhizophagus clarus]|uniref:BTB domain-containing protein n=1 Tax=Rhizophagus clarus TaxID=94130 RepID=A0A2Z6S6M4_9GLOM|nr:hypothetical protein RclHR1_05610009 [Rhizophagus clarus]GES87608.1 hypothetical protein GLOIN_2v1487826 [Rhizophagus clarus]